MKHERERKKDTEEKQNQPFLMYNMTEVMLGSPLRVDPLQVKV